MGFFKSIGKALGNVAKAVVKPVTKLADTVVKNIPVVGSVYNVATNLIGKNLGDIGDLVGGKSGGSSGSAPLTETQAAQTVIDAIDRSNSPTQATYSNSVGAPMQASYQTIPVMPNGQVVPYAPSALSYPSSFLATPAMINSGATNDYIANALTSAGTPVSAANKSSVLDVLLTVYNDAKQLFPKFGDNASKVEDKVLGTAQQAASQALSSTLTDTIKKYIPWILGGAGVLFMFYQVNKKSKR